MHLVENYALGTGLRIGRPFIYDKFVPLPFDGDYVSFQPYSKYDSKNYDFWAEVVQILMPAFNEKKIRILQIGLSDEPKVFGTYDYRGRTSFNQAAYVVRNSILHLGADSFAAHIASGYSKKLVALYSVSYPSQCGPYWSDRREFAAIEPEREKDEKPKYSPQETDKQINRIKPEVIAKAVAKFLKIKLDFPFKAVAVGKKYGLKKVELIPAAPSSNIEEAFGVDSIIVRMDLEFQESVLQSQLSMSNCSIVTDKEIDTKMLRLFRKKIKEFIFLLDKNTDPAYFKELQNAGIKYNLMTTLDEEEFNKIKLKYLDIGPISRKQNRKFEEVEAFKDKNTENLFYRGSSFTVYNGEVYMNKDMSFENSPINDIGSPPLLPVIKSDLFLEDFDHSIFYEKIA